ncbi:MAG: cyclic nucleotide-binding domain-containing protein [Nitrospinae bacterium]|nr:cyclic nucleotide-binding domain-containing protein [Nitrospinota bacterium]
MTDQNNSAAEQKEKWVDLLQTMDFFKTFDRGDLRELFSFGQVRRFRAKEYIIKGDVLDSSFYFLLHGRADVILKPKTGGDAQKIAVLQDGECFGEVAIWLGGSRSASVMATTDCSVYELNKDELERMAIPLQCKMVKRIAYSMAAKIHENNQQLVRFM